MSYTEHQKKVIRLMKNHLSRLNRKLHKSKKFYYSDTPELELRVNEIKEKIKLYKHDILKTKNK